MTGCFESKSLERLVEGVVANWVILFRKTSVTCSPSSFKPGVRNVASLVSASDKVRCVGAGTDLKEF